MPNDSLIQQLDVLRDNYARQQKAIAGLQASLKGVTGALNKAQKSLSDYSEQTSVDVTDALTAIERAALKESLADPLSPTLRREGKALAKATAGLKDAAAALRLDPIDVVKLDKALATLNDLPYAPIGEVLPALSGELEIGQRVLAESFGYKLRDALAAHGLTLIRQGAKFAVGRFELEVNFARRFMTLRYGHDMVVPRAPITVEAAVKAVLDAVEGITGRDEDAAAWMKQFHTAYRIALLKQPEHSPRVNIVSCYYELVLLRQAKGFASEPSKRALVEYTRAQFIHDFYEFTARRRTAHEGQFVRAHSAIKAQVDNPAKSIWMIEGDGPHDGRYIGDIEFERG